MKVKRFAVPLMAVALLGAGTPTAPADSPNPYDVRHLSFESFACSDCDWCGMPFFEHKNNGSGDYGGTVHGCQPGGADFCVYEHWGSCSPSDDGELDQSTSRAAVVSIWNTLTHGRGEELQLVLDTYDNVFYHHARQAVQVTGCTGEIIASVPLTESQLVSLDIDR